jgi:archaellum biogenesis ATPase FlaH/uncharacterized protein YeeX (DUF496 family)
MFSKRFNRAVLNLFIKDDLFLDSIDKFNPDSLFSEDRVAHKWFDRIKTFKNRYKIVNPAVFIEEYGEAANKLLSLNYEDTEEYIRENLKKVIFLSNLKDCLVNKVAPEFEKDIRNINEFKLKEYIEDSLSTWIDDSDKGGLDYFIDPAQRIIEMEYRLGVPTGWYRIDNILMGGGLCPGELGVILARANTGKSAALVNLAMTAAAYGRSVIYITLEMDKRIVAHRMDMRLSGYSSREVMENIAELSRKIKKFKEITGSEIYLKEYRSEEITVRGIDSFIKKLYKKYRTDFIVVDYADIIKPSKSKYAREDLAYREIYTDLRLLAGKWDVPIWTASQANKLLPDGEILDIRTFADSFAKSFISDIVISINQTKKQKEIKEAFFYLAKNRNAAAHRGVDLKADFDRMLIADISDYEIYYAEKDRKKSCKEG